MAQSVPEPFKHAACVDGCAVVGACRVHCPAFDYECGVLRWWHTVVVKLSDGSFPCDVVSLR